MRLVSGVLGTDAAKIASRVACCHGTNALYSIPQFSIYAALAPSLERKAAYSRGAMPISPAQGETLYPDRPRAQPMRLLPRKRRSCAYPLIVRQATLPFMTKPKTGA